MRMIVRPGLVESQSLSLSNLQIDPSHSVLMYTVILGFLFKSNSVYPCSRKFIGVTAVKKTVCLPFLASLPPAIKPDLVTECKLVEYLTW